MTVQIKKAVKFGAKLRLALYGPSGSGKTYTALALARELASDKRVILIDTERGSASKYADEFDFDVIELDSFHPNSYIDAIRAAAQTKEYEVLVIDSASHEWEGSKGALELAGRDFTNWANVTPLHNKFVDAMLDADIHVIVTMRAKEGAVMEEQEVNGKKKNVVRKLGMEPIQRKGIQYEFDIIGSLDMENEMAVEKTRCSALKSTIFRPGQERDFVTTALAWLDGVKAPEPTQQQKDMRRLLDEFYALSPATYARIANWQDMALRRALEVAEGEPVPTEYTDDDVRRMDLYVALKRKEKTQKAS